MLNFQVVKHVQLNSILVEETQQAPPCQDFSMEITHCIFWLCLAVMSTVIPIADYCECNSLSISCSGKHTFRLLHQTVARPLLSESNPGFIHIDHTANDFARSSWLPPSGIWCQRQRIRHKVPWGRSLLGDVHDFKNNDSTGPCRTIPLSLLVIVKILFPSCDRTVWSTASLVPNVFAEAGSLSRRARKEAKTSDIELTEPATKSNHSKSVEFVSALEVCQEVQQVDCKDCPGTVCRCCRGLRRRYSSLAFVATRSAKLQLARLP